MFFNRRIRLETNTSILSASTVNDENKSRTGSEHRAGHTAHDFLILRHGLQIGSNI